MQFFLIDFERVSCRKKIFWSNSAKQLKKKNWGVEVGYVTGTD
jgi:hypothetical protein